MANRFMQWAVLGWLLGLGAPQASAQFEWLPTEEAQHQERKSFKSQQRARAQNLLYAVGAMHYIDLQTQADSAWHQARQDLRDASHILMDAEDKLALARQAFESSPWYEWGGAIAHMYEAIRLGIEAAEKLASGASLLDQVEQLVQEDKDRLDQEQQAEEGGE